MPLFGPAGGEHAGDAVALEDLQHLVERIERIGLLVVVHVGVEQLEPLPARARCVAARQADRARARSPRPREQPAPSNAPIVAPVAGRRQSRPFGRHAARANPAAVLTLALTMTAAAGPPRRAAPGLPTLKLKLAFTPLVQFMPSCCVGFGCRRDAELLVAIADRRGACGPAGGGVQPLAEQPGRAAGPGGARPVGRGAAMALAESRIARAIATLDELAAPRRRFLPARAHRSAAAGDVRDHAGQGAVGRRGRRPHAVHRCRQPGRSSARCCRPSAVAADSDMLLEVSGSASGRSRWVRAPPAGRRRRRTGSPR